MIPKLEESRISYFKKRVKVMLLCVQMDEFKSCNFWQMKAPYHDLSDAITHSDIQITFVHYVDESTLWLPIRCREH